MFTEDDLLPLSGLQHMSFCERRWALVQIEQIWENNRFTAEGNVIHEKAHSGMVESRPGVLVRRTLPLRSFRLGLCGQADIIEFHPVQGGEGGVSLEDRAGFWRPYPVEYKRSRDKAGSSAYQIQLCAQALCLEEMLEAKIPAGAVYGSSTRRRQVVEFDPALRARTEALAARMHELHRAGVTPLARYEPKCEGCSLMARCLPRLLSKPPTVARYLARALAAGED
jgi:CRISPR-associated exonuclease Cas4